MYGLWLALLAFAAGTSSGQLVHSLQPCSPPAFDTAVKHLSEIIQFETVSDSNADRHVRNSEEFHKLGAWLSHTYTDVWEHMTVEKVGDGGMSHLLSWQGSQADLHPVLFISHIDVVPVAADTLQDWTYPPFSGAVADGYIWGRGALDVKVGVVTLLEAATALLQEGYKQQRTLLFAFGHDEEVGGVYGAGEIAALLSQRGVQLEMIIDEGMGIALDGLAPFTKQPVALLGTGEKQLLTVKVGLQSMGGHSSKPPIDGSSIAGKMGRFMAAVSDNPPRPKLVSPTTDFLIAAADLAPVWLAPVLRLVQHFAPTGVLLAAVMARLSEEAAALVRTTAAVTLASAGVAHNILPQTGWVTVNFRLLPGDTAEGALKQTRAWLARDAASATVSLVEQQLPQPMPVANASGPHFAIMKSAIHQAWRRDGQAAGAAAAPVDVLPVLLPAMTDSRAYSRLSPRGCLRWTPFTFTKAGNELARFHNVNERLSLADYACGLVTYQSLVRQFGSYTGEQQQQQQQQQQRRRPGQHGPGTANTEL